LVISSAL
jgi:hypothetical protein